MAPVIYADTLFLFNFLVNTVILVITAKFTGEKIRILRIVQASAMGGIYTVLMFFPKLKIMYTLFFKTIILFGIYLIAFGNKNIIKLLKNFGVFLLINLSLGGALLALIFLTEFGTAVGSVVSGSGIYINLSPFILLFGITGIYIFLGVYHKMSKRELYEKSLIKRIKLEYKNKVAEVDVFLDTGCRIVDPVNDKPAIIAELDRIKVLLSEEETENIINEKDVGMAYAKGLRVLPFSTINGENQIFGIVADRITLM